MNMKRLLCAAWLLMTMQALVQAASVSNIINLRETLLANINYSNNYALKKKEDGFPWGKQQFVQAIDLAMERYNASLNVVSEYGEVIDESKITDEYEAELDSANTELHDARYRFEGTNVDFRALNFGTTKRSKNNKPHICYMEADDIHVEIAELMLIQGGPRSERLRLASGLRRSL